MVKSAVNIVVPGFLLTFGGAHPAAVRSVREGEDVGCAHCGHTQREDTAGWAPGKSLQLSWVGAHKRPSLSSYS